MIMADRLIRLDMEIKNILNSDILFKRHKIKKLINKFKSDALGGLKKQNCSAKDVINLGLLIDTAEVMELYSADYLKTSIFEIENICRKGPARSRWPMVVTITIKVVVNSQTQRKAIYVYEAAMESEFDFEGQLKLKCNTEFEIHPGLGKFLMEGQSYEGVALSKETNERNKNLQASGVGVFETLYELIITVISNALLEKWTKK